MIFPLHGIGDIKLLDLHLSYSPDQVSEHLTRLGAEGRSAYARMALSSDLIFPVSYTLALSVALLLVLRKLSPPDSRIRQLCLFPFLILIVDWGENLSLALITRSFPERADTLIRFASALTSLKWTLVVLTVLMLSLAATNWAANSIRGK